MSRKDAKYRSDGEGCGGWTGMGAVEMGGDEKIWRTNKCRSAVILESLDFFLPLPRNDNNVKFACTRVIRLFTEVLDLFINIHNTY